jgi:protein gp37
LDLTASAGRSAAAKAPGRAARPMLPAWARSVRDQSAAAGAKFFMKQTGSNRTPWPGVRHPKGETVAEWPADLQIREWPR